jgi:prophage antirepressor-like protein
MKNKTHKTIIKEFLGEDVRIIKTDKHEYVVCEDMFKVLGYVKPDGTWEYAREIMLELLDGIDKKDSCQKLKIIQNGIEKEVECLNVENAFIVMTQFQPSKDIKKVFEEWVYSMKFLGVILGTECKIGD